MPPQSQMGVLLFICLRSGFACPDVRRAAYESVAFNIDIDIGISNLQDEALSVLQHSAVLLQKSKSQEQHLPQLSPTSIAGTDEGAGALLQTTQSLNSSSTGKSPDQSSNEQTTFKDIIAKCDWEIVLWVSVVFLVLVLGHTYASGSSGQQSEFDKNSPFKPHRRSSLVTGYAQDAFELACHKAFESCDKDGSGCIDEKEIYSAVLKFYVHAAKKVSGLKAPSKDVVMKLAKTYAQWDDNDSDTTTMNYAEFQRMIQVLAEQLVWYAGIQSVFVYGVTPFIAIYVALFIDTDILPIAVKYMPFLSSRMAMVTPWCNNMITCLILTHCVPYFMAFVDRQLLKKHNIEDGDEDM